MRKWNKKETGRYRETGGEWEKTYVLYIHWPVSIFFSTGDSCGHTLSTSALGAPPKHTRSHTHTHYTHTVHTPKSKHQNDLYTVFIRPTCAHLVWCLSKCTDGAFITRYLHLSWFIQRFRWIMVRPPCLSQDGEGRDRSLFTAEACRSGCRRSAGLHTFTLRSCELQPVGLWAAPSWKSRVNCRAHSPRKHLFFSALIREEPSITGFFPGHSATSEFKG